MKLNEKETIDSVRLPHEGLSSAEVKEQIRKKNVNISKTKAGKSYAGIIFDNLFTFFNFVWALVTVVLVAVDSFTNLTYLFIIIPNILIGIISEIRAKRTVEKLSVNTQPRATVIRDGKMSEIKVSSIVLGDVVKLEMGQQIPADSVVLSGLAEVNESMLTGESDAIKKCEGDTVLAGSYLVSGSIYVRVEKVGKDNYIHKIESAAKNFKAPKSNLFRDLNKLIKYIGIFMIPMTVILAITNYLDTDHRLIPTIEKTSGSVIGMIPAGIYLLVTLTLTLSVIKLARKKTLVQDMYSIEMLASADVLCLDKTGTITDGTMTVVGVESLDGTSEEEIAAAVAALESADDSINNTARALIERFGKSECEIIDKVPFSSERKYSAIKLADSAWAIGAPGFVPCYVHTSLNDKIKERASLGERVLILARLDSLESVGRAVAMITIADTIRPSAEDTIARFQEQGVAIKIISGDHARTVSAIAARVGVNGASNYISCENMSDEELVSAADSHTVFGRVTPEQKVLLVKALRDAGHTVAMTGDGVNDTLALKEADCAIAMADGSEVARKVSDIVLMNSDFSTLPSVVNEGRRCINNVRNSAVLFLMKTLFVIVLSIISACLPTVTYPFEPKQFLLIEMFVIGAASFLLALEPNYERIKGSFINTVVIKSIPSALALLIPTVIILVVGMSSVTLSQKCIEGVATVTVTFVGYLNLMALCRPTNKWRTGVLIFVGVSLVAAAIATIYIGQVVTFISIPKDPLYLLSAFNNPMFMIGMIGVSASVCGLLHLLGFSDWAIDKLNEKALKLKKK